MNAEVNDLHTAYLKEKNNFLWKGKLSFYKKRIFPEIQLKTSGRLALCTLRHWQVCWSPWQQEQGHMNNNVNTLMKRLYNSDGTICRLLGWKQCPLLDHRRKNGRAERADWKKENKSGCGNSFLSLMKYLNSVTFNLSQALSDIKFWTGFVRLEDAEQVSWHFWGSEGTS